MNTPEQIRAYDAKMLQEKLKLSKYFGVIKNTVRQNDLAKQYADVETYLSNPPPIGNLFSVEFSEEFLRDDRIFYEAEKALLQVMKYDVAKYIISQLSIDELRKMVRFWTGIKKQMTEKYYKLDKSAATDFIRNYVAERSPTDETNDQLKIMNAWLSKDQSKQQIDHHGNQDEEIDDGDPNETFFSNASIQHISSPATPARKKLSDEEYATLSEKVKSVSKKGRRNLLQEYGISEAKPDVYNERGILSAKKIKERLENPPSTPLKQSGKPIQQYDDLPTDAKKQAFTNANELMQEFHKIQDIDALGVAITEFFTKHYGEEKGAEVSADIVRDKRTKKKGTVVDRGTILTKLRKALNDVEAPKVQTQRATNLGDRFAEVDDGPQKLKGEGLRHVPHFVAKRRGRPRIVGSGLASPTSPASPKIFPARLFLKNPKFFIETEKLDKCILSVKYKTNSTAHKDFRDMHISHSCRDVLLDILNEKYDFPLYKALNQRDKIIVNNFCKKFGYPIDTTDDAKQYQEEFDLLIGEYQSGNENPEIIRKIKAFVIQGMNAGYISQRKGMNLIMAITI